MIYGFQANNSAIDMYARMYRTSKGNTEFDKSAIALSDGKFQHDATMNFVKSTNSVYVFTLQNDVNKGDSASYANAYVKLIKINCKSMSIAETWDICKHGSEIDGKTVTSGCGIPNSYLVGNTLHLIWTAKLSNGVWYEFHCPFNVATNTAGDIEICQLNGYDMSAQALSNLAGIRNNWQISMNGTIAEYNGEYYIGAQIQKSFSNSMILKTSDFVNYTLFVVPQFIDGLKSKALYETSIIRGVNYDGFYLAVRQEGSGTIVAKMRTDGTIEENILVPSDSSRPWLFNKGKITYLFVGQRQRRVTNVLQLSGLYGVDSLNTSFPFADFHSGNYMTVEDNNTTNDKYFLYTNGSSGLRFGHANIFDDRLAIISKLYAADK